MNLLEWTVGWINGPNWVMGSTPKTTELDLLEQVIELTGR